MHKSTLILFSFLSLVSFGQNNTNKDIDKLALFIKSIDQRYVDSVETSAIIESGLKAMLKELDPHSVYFSPEQYKAANEPLKGQFKGIGIRYQVIDDTLTVIEVLADSPAMKGEMQIGDQLIAIGHDTLSGKQMRSSKMSERIKDPTNTDRPFLVIRQGAQQEVILSRDNVAVSSIPAYFMLNDEIGYIKLNRFSSTSLTDFRKALDELEKDGMKDLIFDLRGNSGGYLNVAIRIIDEFLEDRKLIVYTEGTHQAKKDTYATTGGRFVKGDLIVLIDEKSASASEIVAGAIQDWDRGLIVGRRSYGKGLVQRTIEFEDGSAMRLTISRYYTPTGRSIQRPYDDGVDAYRKDLSVRKKSGEFYSQDSMKLDTSHVYFTPSRRKVYGGGGIVPDVFIAADTGNPNPIWSQINKTNLHYLFALNYQRNHQLEIHQQYPSIREFAANFSLTTDDMNDLKIMLKHRGFDFSDEDYSRGYDDLKNSVEGLISRFVYGYSDQFFFVQSKDRAVLRSMDIIQNDTFSELGLK